MMHVKKGKIRDLKRVLSILLAAAMTFGNMGSFGAMAEELSIAQETNSAETPELLAETPTAIENFTSLKTAFTKGGNYKLTADIELSEAIDIAASQAVTLDLNGKTLSANLSGGTNGDNSGDKDVAVIDVRTGGSLIINDTSATSAGKITNAGARIVIFVAGELTLNGGTVEATDNQINGNYAVKTYHDNNSLGKFTMTGGKLTSAGDTVIWNNGGAVSISGGEVVGPLNPTTNDRQVIHSKHLMKGGLKRSTLEISGNAKVTAKNGCALKLQGCDFTMSGGNVTATYDVTPGSNPQAAVSTENGAMNSNSTMDISGGTISAPVGIYDMFAYQEPSYSVINISGTANITGTAGNGVQSNGDVSVSGGTIISLTDYAIQGQYPGKITLTLENSNDAYSTSRFYGGTDGTQIVNVEYATLPAGYKISTGTLPAGEKDCHYLTKDSEITFNTYGGEEIAAVQVENGQKLNKPTTPTRAGYVFDGWYKEQECTNPWDFNAEITKPEEIHAKWTEIPKYALTVTGGTGSGSYAEGTSVTIKANSKPGYVFVGWTVPDGVSVADKAKKETTLTMPANEITVTAGYSFIDDDENDNNNNNNNNKTPISIDGKIENIGRAEETKNETSVTIDQKELGKKLADAKKDGDVVVPVADNRQNASAKLLLKNIDEMAAKNSTLTVRSGAVDYRLRAAAVDTKALMAELGAKNAEQVPITITIGKVTEPVELEGGKLVVPPVTFTFMATYGGKTAIVENFDKYACRLIKITAEQASRITTAVVCEPNGKLRHVPTNVFEQNGVWYAAINSLSNSTYALIANDKSFADTKGMWYEAVANEMASRRIMQGMENLNFEGDRVTTRAEFAATVVRALGLNLKSNVEYKDVPQSAWYADVAAIATKYNLMHGFEGNFRPNEAISRQEAMLVITRAAEIVEFKAENKAETEFSDFNKVAFWAKEGVGFATANGLIQGFGGELRPNDDISRSETATVCLRLLQKAKLVDIRTDIK